jgi:plasmid rolling circle replication initiator protein Rep
MKITEQLRRNELVKEKFWRDVKDRNLFLLCPNCNWRDAINQMGIKGAKEEALKIVLREAE